VAPTVAAARGALLRRRAQLAGVDPKKSFAPISCGSKHKNYTSDLRVRFNSRFSPLFFLNREYCLISNQLNQFAEAAAELIAVFSLLLAVKWILKM